MKYDENSELSDHFEPVAPPAPTVFEKKARKRKALPLPTHSDPVAELRKLVNEHRFLTQSAVRISNMQTDKKIKATGELKKSTMPDDLRADYRAVVKRTRAAATALESRMLRELKQIPIYQKFLSWVYGCGPVVAAYLTANIRIERSVKISQLRRYCGNAVDMNGRLERRSAGPKYAPDGSLTGAEGTYNATLRTALWQMMTAAFKNSAKVLSDAPHGVTSKYLDVWESTIHREWSAGREKGAFKKGRHKATDVFLEDLYIAWRAIEGLEVWPSYYAAKLGYEHGGKISVNAPRSLTVEQALEIVGDVGKRARSAASQFKKAAEEEEGGEELGGGED